MIRSDVLVVASERHVRHRVDQFALSFRSVLKLIEVQAKAFSVPTVDQKSDEHF